MLAKLLAMAALIVLTATVFMVQSMTSTVYGICAGGGVCAFASFGCAIATAFGLTVTAGC